MELRRPELEPLSSLAGLLWLYTSRTCSETNPQLYYAVPGLKHYAMWGLHELKHGVT